MEVYIMYFVDRMNIRDTLIYIEDLITSFDPEREYDSFKEKLALERITHMLIEAVLDVGNMMIDGFVMRDPGSYEDIITILVDEEVIPEEDEESYKKLIRLRKMVVNDYLQIDHAKLYAVLREIKEVLLQFSSHITAYLQEEMDVPHAFTNE